MTQRISLQKMLDDGRIWHGKQGCNAFRAPAPSPFKASSPFEHIQAGSIHEFSLTSFFNKKSYSNWNPPLVVVLGLLSTHINTKSATENHTGFIFWLGSKTWPTPYMLARFFNSQTWQKHNLFIKTQSKKTLLLAAHQSLSSPAVTASIIDASGLTFIETKKLSLAAKKTGTLGLLLRPFWEHELPSASHSRWEVSATPSSGYSPQWTVVLTKARGLTAPCRWHAIWDDNDEKNPLHFLSDVSDRAEKTTITNSTRQQFSDKSDTSDLALPRQRISL